MKCYYPAKVLEDKLKEVKNTREYLISNSFPSLNIDEIIKIDFIIVDLQKAINCITARKKTVTNVDDYKKIYDLYNKGNSAAKLGVIYNASRETMRTIVNEYKSLVKKYKNNA